MSHARYFLACTFRADRCFASLLSAQSLERRATQRLASASLTVPGEKHLRNVRQLTFGGHECRSLFFGRRQDTDLPCIRARACPAIRCTPCRSTRPTASRRRRSWSARARAARPAATFSRPATAFCFPRRTPPAPPARRSPIIRTATSGRFTTPTKSTPRSPMAAICKPLTHAPGYNAESTISRDGKNIVFTSTRNGDLDIYTMNADGTDVQPAHARAGLRRRPVLVRRRQENRVPRRASENAGADRRLQGFALARTDSPRQPGNLGDGRRRQQQAPGDAQRRGEFRALSSSRRQAHHFCVEHGEPEETPAASISTSSTRTAPASSRSPIIPISTPSRCFPPTASAWCGPPIATAKRRTRPTSSSPIGWSEAVVGCQLSVVSFATRVPRSNVVLAKAGPFNEVR